MTELDALRMLLTEANLAWWKAWRERGGNFASLKRLNAAADRVIVGQSQPRRCAAEEFVCDICGKTVPWSQGAADDLPDTCDSCWGKLHNEPTDDILFTGRDADGEGDPSCSAPRLCSPAPGSAPRLQRWFELSDLQRYCLAKAKGDRGWRSDHDERVSPWKGGNEGAVAPEKRIAQLEAWASRYIRLTGHYVGLLDALVDAVGGPDAVLELLDARDRYLEARDSASCAHGSSTRVLSGLSSCSAPRALELQHSAGAARRSRIGGG